MNTKKLLIYFFASLFLFAACNAKTEQKQSVETKAEKYVFAHPEWIKNKTIYEVNLRQYSEAGTIKEFQKNLPKLKELGIDILWFMPIHPIGTKNRKGSLGSYYAVEDYKAVNPEFGTLDDFKAIVKEAHAMGMHVILDWVANHTAWESVWAKSNPEWFTKDSLGGFMPPAGTDWADVIDLNYDNKDMRAAMIDALEFWVKEADIDGYRCDVAASVPLDFWQDARKALDKIKPVFMLAEAEELTYHDRAFDMSYGWHLNSIFNDIAAGKTNADVLRKYWEEEQKKGLDERFRMIFTTNHDENTWHGTVFERLGDAAQTFAVLTVTMPGMPLIYSGQEAGLDKRLEFFEQDPIEWKESPMRGFYTKLFQLRRKNKALWIGEEMGKFEILATTADDHVFACLRSKNENAVLTIANLSGEEQHIKIDSQHIAGEYENLFSGEKQTVSNKIEMKLKAWEYIVLYK